MNNQVNHILHGVFSLIVFAGVFFLLSKIPGDKVAVGNKKEFLSLANNDTKPLSESAAFGKALFNSKCAACHRISYASPASLSRINNEQWSDRQKLYAWIRNPEEFMKTDKYTRDLKDKFRSTMIGFPDMRDEEVDAIVEYVNSFPRN